jgi:hypothetical protein
MDINKTLNSFDQIAVTGTGAVVTINGKLNLNIIGTLAAGDQFPLFTGSSFNGVFESIVPATPGEGLVWEFTNGVLKVVDPNVTDVPAIITTHRVVISPNPLKTIGYLTLDKKYSKITVNIESVTGILIAKNTYSNTSSVEMDWSKVPSGMYLINVLADGERLSVQRIVKE